MKTGAVTTNQINILIPIITLVHPHPTRQDTNGHYYYYYSVFLLYISLAGSYESMGLADQALVIHCSSKNFLTIRHILSITAVSIRIHTPSRGLISCNLFGIIPVVDSTYYYYYYYYYTIAIIIITIIISFTQGIYSYIPENTVLQLFCCYYSQCLHL